MSTASMTAKLLPCGFTADKGLDAKLGKLQIQLGKLQIPACLRVAYVKVQIRVSCII